jgi:hypothetical protein
MFHVEDKQGDYRWQGYRCRYGLFSCHRLSSAACRYKLLADRWLSRIFVKPPLAHSKAKFALRQSLGHLQRSRPRLSYLHRANDFDIRHVSPNFGNLFSRICLICPDDPQCKAKISPSNCWRTDFVHQITVGANGVLAYSPSSIVGP